MDDLGGNLWSTMTRVGSCSYELALLVLFVVVLISALRIKRSIGTYLFAASTLGTVAVSVLYDILDATHAIPYEVSSWVWALGGVIEIVLAAVALAGIALVRPRAPAAPADAHLGGAS